MELTMPIVLLFLLAALYAVLGLKIVNEHEQGVVTRFGRFLSVVPPGLRLVVPFVDVLRRVDLRTLTVEQRIDPASGAGKVRIWDEVWPARSADGEQIGPGTPISVVAIDGEFIVVAPRR